MTPKLERDLTATRRQFFGRTAAGIGPLALSSLLLREGYATTQGSAQSAVGLPSLPHFAPTAKRVIYMFQSGAPSQIDLFDHKPLLRKFHGQDLPDTIRKGQRITGMTSGQDRLPVAASIFQFHKHGQSGTELSELLPHTAKVVDDVAFVKTVQTDAINHDPAITFMQSGFQQPGRPSMGSWVSYGAWQREPGPPRICRVDLARQQPQPIPAALLATMGLRVPAIPVPRSQVPLWRRSCPVPIEPAWHRLVDPAKHAGHCC